MLRGLFGNLTDVVKNLLILNLLFFLATVVFEKQGIFLIQELGLHYPSSDYFEPYQIATHFFMHASVGHILLNMLALVVFGVHLERLWGPKRFLVFYFVTALGAAFLHMLVMGIELHQWTGSWFPTYDTLDPRSSGAFKAAMSLATPSVGASGAIYGLIMAFAMLFPNTRLMLYFAIPVKAKYVAIGLGVFALISGIQANQGDSVAHFAHLGGMLFGYILLRIWQKDKTNFY